MLLRRTAFLSGALQATGLPVVVDVFRAFTSCAILIQKGIKSLSLVAQTEQAVEIGRQSRSLVMGEVGGRKPAAFDLPSSPTWLLRLPSAALAGRDVVCCTSSGSGVVVAACQTAGRAFLSSYVVAEATARGLLDSSPQEVTLVASGTGGRVEAVEDEACIDYLESLLVAGSYNHVDTVNGILQDKRSLAVMQRKLPYFPTEEMILALQRDVFSFAMEARGTCPPINVTWTQRGEGLR